jgi:hypothetical protein
MCPDHSGAKAFAAALPNNCPTRPLMSSGFLPSAALAACTKSSSPRIRLRITSAASTEC